ncbi:HNH endonuclease signature motif containing protein [Streptomyces sp. NPDC037389]|uniref:HNH endonuclease n=1 Tax=Streptomyces sp. NPDC037389 TaxID=3155369 RepID=UPI00340EB5AC
MDHVIPLAAGGEDNSKNLVPACDECNLSKSDNPLPQWIMRREFRRLSVKLGSPLGEVTLLDQYQDAHQECVRTIRRVQAVCQEIANPARRRWFRCRFPEKRTPRDREEVDHLRFANIGQVDEGRLSGYSETPRAYVSDPDSIGSILDAFFGK